MGLMMKHILLLTILVSMASCVPEEVKTSNPQSARWNLSRNNFPLEMKLSSDFNISEKSEIRSSSSNWDSSVGGGVTLLNDTQETSPKSNDLDSYNDGTMGIYKVFNWPNELPDSALAVTQLFGIRKNIGTSNEYIEITHADILINYDNDFNYFTTQGYDLQTVVLHEMGHFLGLFHQDTSRDVSVMYPSISRFTNNRIPKQRDVNDIKSLYPVGGGAAPAQSGRGLASASAQDSGPSEAVVVLFELKAEGGENVIIRNQKTNKIISHDTAGCEH